METIGYNNTREYDLTFNYHHTSISMFVADHKKQIIFLIINLIIIIIEKQIKLFVLKKAVFKAFVTSSICNILESGQEYIYKSK